MIIDISVVEPENLDFKSHAHLLQTAFQEVLKGTGEESTLSPEFFRWKYSGPIAPAKIAIIRENGKMVAANSMFAFDIIWKEKIIRGWQSGDTATLPEARGKGYFVKCIQALGDTLKPNEIFFGFPNGSSIRGLEKAGWKERYIMPAWARVIPPLTKTDPNVTQIKEFDQEHDLLFKAYAKSPLPMIEKTSAYMNWRYMKHPVGQYKAFAYKGSQNVDGVIVLRKVSGFDRKMAVILDLIAINPIVETKLYKFAASWAAENNLWPTITLTTNLNYSRGLRNLYFPVPSKLMPKRQVLLGKTSGPVAEEVFSQRWNLQLGDWDGY